MSDSSLVHILTDSWRRMILICVATDVLPALSMCFEPPETGLLSRPPRDVKKERLADWRLLVHAYGFLGILESLCAMSMCVPLVKPNKVNTVPDTPGQVFLVLAASWRSLLVVGARFRQLACADE